MEDHVAIYAGTDCQRWRHRGRRRLDHRRECFPHSQRPAALSRLLSGKRDRHCAEKGASGSSEKREERFEGAELQLHAASLSETEIQLIYLDYNATTPLSATAREAMRPFLEEYFGNPPSVHAAGREARAAIDDARDRIAILLGAKPHEIVFTSGGTEANNLALLGLARRLSPNGKHLISNRAEHHAVLQTLEHLERKEGFEVTWLDLSPDGLVDPDHLTKAIRRDTILVLDHERE